MLTFPDTFAAALDSLDSLGTGLDVKKLQKTEDVTGRIKALVCTLRLDGTVCGDWMTQYQSTRNLVRVPFQLLVANRKNISSLANILRCLSRNEAVSRLYAEFCSQQLQNCTGKYNNSSRSEPCGYPISEY